MIVLIKNHHYIFSSFSFLMLLTITYNQFGDFCSASLNSFERLKVMNFEFCDLTP